MKLGKKILAALIAYDALSCIRNMTDDFLAQSQVVGATVMLHTARLPQPEASTGSAICCYICWLLCFVTVLIYFVCHYRDTFRRYITTLLILRTPQ